VVQEPVAVQERFDCREVHESSRRQSSSAVSRVASGSSCNGQLLANIACRGDNPVGSRRTRLRRRLVVPLDAARVLASSFVAVLRIDRLRLLGAVVE
jgi:hypothetical protein